MAAALNDSLTPSKKLDLFFRGRIAENKRKNESELESLKNFAIDKLGKKRILFEDIEIYCSHHLFIVCNSYTVSTFSDELRPIT